MGGQGLNRDRKGSAVRGGASVRGGARELGIPFAPASAVPPEAASGLRPAALLVGIVLVLSVVALRAAWIQGVAEGAQPDATLRREAPTPGFTILDREGRPLAMSVECFDVTLSPQALWRSHTPARVASKLADVLAKVPRIGFAGASQQAAEADHKPWTTERVLRRAMPESLVSGSLKGRLVPHQPVAVVFAESDLERVQHWLDTGYVDEETAGSERGPIRGLSLVPIAGRVPAGWTLAMEPVACLGRDSRVDQFGTYTENGGKERTVSPDRWTRRLLDGLILVIGREELTARLSVGAQGALRGLAPPEQTERLRDIVWSELMPSRFRILARAIDPVRAHALRKVMAAEGISPWQIQLVSRVQRRHPTRPGTVPVAPYTQQLSADGSAARLALVDESSDDFDGGDAFTLLGHWGVLDVARADARARRDREARPYVLPWDEAADPFDAYRKSLVVERRPLSGIELLCQSELENGPWAPIGTGIHGRSYERRVRHVARDRRRAWKDGVPDYYQSAVPGTDIPSIDVTLDARLQEVLHTELGLLMDAHRPALAMGIAVDVETGDVLALDARSMYGYSGFAPVRHEFTPGSTFKAIIMALALDAGLTYPDEPFETFFGRGLRLGSRTILEAEGAPTTAKISAAEGLAHSVNAVLVQIALRFDAADLRQKLLELGYSSSPGAGLGPERPGRLTPLRNGSWSRNQTHASVGFGHELTVTLWQHAAALATVLRGGERRPLRLLRSIERGGEIWDHEAESGGRVLSASACDSVRAMMAVGAESGTGRHVARREQHPEFSWIGTKTGTTERVPSELCVHVELEALAEAARNGQRWDRDARKALFAIPRPHPSDACYTSSMCAAARMAMPGGGEREIMVLIVADDAMGEEHFGSRVTGPTALAVLRQAFGLERTHVPASEVEASSVASSDAAQDRSRGVRPERPGRVIYGRSAAGSRGRNAASEDSSVVFDSDWLNDDLPWEARDEVNGAEERR